MSTNRDVDRIVRSWLDEGVTQLPDRVLDAVLDQLPATPQRRPWWPARRFLQVNNFARIVVAAAAVTLIAIVGISLAPWRGVGNSNVSPTPSASTVAPTPTASTPALSSLVGQWAAPETTCEQLVAAIEASGFTPEQITASGVGDPACPSGGTDRFKLSFLLHIGTESPIVTFIDDSQLPAISYTSAFAYGEQWRGRYRVVDEQTVELSDADGAFCLAYRYAIDGDQLSMQMIGHGCPGKGDAPLRDQVFQTGFLETSTFTKQP